MVFAEAYGELSNMQIGLHGLQGLLKGCRCCEAKSPFKIITYVENCLFEIWSVGEADTTCVSTTLQAERLIKNSKVGSEGVKDEDIF